MSIKITFSDGKIFESDDDEVSLYEANRDIHGPIPFMCRVGMCCICKVVISDPTKVSKKTIEDKQSTEGEDQRLACLCYVSGDISVERVRTNKP